MASNRVRRRALTRILRGLAYTFALISIVLVLAVGFLILYPERAVRYAAGTISASTGRELALNGPVEVRVLSWRPRLVLHDVTFANADWSKNEHMVDTGRFEVVLALRRLLRGDLVFKKIAIADTTARLEQRKDGSNNWTFWAAEAAQPDERGDVPAVLNIHVRKSRLYYTREGVPEPTDLQIDKATGGLNKKTTMTAQGRFQQRPAKLVAEAGTIKELQDEDTPFPLKVAIDASDTSASIDGHLTGGLEEGGLDVVMKLKGDTLSDLYTLIGVVLPESPPYQVTGKLGRHGTVWSYDGFDGRMGDSDLSGDVKVDVGPERPVMTASFRSKLLDFDDLAGLVGAPPATGAGETASSEQKAEVAKNTAQQRLLPDQPIDVPRLHAMDVDARLVATKVNAPKHVPIDKLDLHITLKDGTLRAEPATFNVGNGTVQLNATLDSGKKPAHVDLDMKAQNLQAARILGDTPFTKDTSGRISGGVKLAMAGNSVRAMAASADGNLQLAMADARVSHLLVELMGLDVQKSIGVLLKGDEPLPIRCAAFDLAATDGIFRSKLGVIDTEKSNITFDVVLDLETENLDMRVVPHPKDTSFLALRQDLRVEGKLINVAVYPDPLKLGPVKGFMRKLNFVLAPVVGLLTPFDIADDEDKDDNGCAAFLREASAPQTQSAKAKSSSRNKGLIPPKQTASKSKK